VELRHLRYFVAVAEERHFGRPAARMHMAQPPLSQQIRQMEAELGFSLFERTTRRVDLTEPGRAYLEHARAILVDLERAGERARRVAAGVRLWKRPRWSRSSLLALASQLSPKESHASASTELSLPLGSGDTSIDLCVAVRTDDSCPVVHGALKILEGVAGSEAH
jgi:DNA-binding transcriptional LysR family regulator